jgi:hypothetical protein
MDDSAPVGVALIQNDMIRQLNDANPPLIILRDNNSEDSPIVGVPGCRLKQNLEKTAAFIVAMQSGNRTLGPLGEIADATGKKSERRLIDT